MVWSKPAISSLEGSTTRIAIFFASGLILFVAFLAALRATYTGQTRGTASLIWILTWAAVLAVGAVSKVIILLHHAKPVHARGRKAFACLLAVVIPLAVWYWFVAHGSTEGETRPPTSLLATLVLAAAMWFTVLVLDIIALRIILPELAIRGGGTAAWNANLVATVATLIFAFLCRAIGLYLW